MKTVSKFLLIPLIAAIIACFLFFLVALIPQSAIQQNAAQSARELVSQPQWMTVLNSGDPSYTMDNYTDSQIILQSYNLTISNLESILSNPKHISEIDNTNMALALDEVVNQGAENETNYVRYWMGFRMFVRPLLLIGSYYDIRKIVAITFFVLLFAALIGITKRVNAKTAMCLGLAMTLVNPAIVSQSLQFSCTFILTFLFILYICYFKRENIRLEFIFCAFGVLTQLFDFYTTPIITYGIPVLVCLMIDNNTPKPILTIVKTSLSWLYGYASMWLIKLLLVTMFTDINGFADGFLRLAQRTGIVIMEEAADKYNSIGALKAVWKTVFPGTVGKIIFCAIIILTLVKMGIIWYKCGGKELLNKSILLLIAALPIVWFIFTAQPTYIHAWFQYRSLIVTFFGLALFIFRQGYLGKRQENANRIVPSD